MRERKVLEQRNGMYSQERIKIHNRWNANENEM